MLLDNWKNFSLTNIKNSMISNYLEKQRLQKDLSSFHCLKTNIEKIEKGNKEAKEALYDLIKIILNPIKDEYIRNAYLNSIAIDSLYLKDIFGFAWYDSHYCKILDKSEHANYVVNLAYDVIFPVSWHQSSIIHMLGSIGKPDRKCGEFKQSNNHMVTLLLPMNIALVRNGNHSIAQGVITANGMIIPDEILDLHAYFDFIYFDGVKFRDKRHQNTVYQPRHPEFGWIWEIARLL